jgi:hypothetical protein
LYLFVKSSIILHAQKVLVCEWKIMASERHFVHSLTSA